MTSSLPRAALFALALPWLASCDGTISVTFTTGPQEFEVSTGPLALPAELEADDGTIERVPCGPMGMCPSADEISITCEADVCDPAPKTLSAPVGGVIDVEALLADSREVGLRVVDAYEVVSVEYRVLVNTLTVPIDDIEVYWGPAAAITIDPELGVRRFGTVPRLAAGATPTGQVVIDGVGVGQLSDYLVGGGSQIRFFAQTTADLEPGDPFPAGSVRVSVNVTIRAVGSVLD